MAGFGYKYLIFLVVFHTLAFQAQSTGMLEQETPQNRHAKVISEFSSSNLTEQATVSDEARIRSSGAFSRIGALAGFINTVVKLLISPYTAIEATSLPSFFQILIKGIIGITEAYVAYLFVRGGA